MNSVGNVINFFRTLDGDQSARKKQYRALTKAISKMHWHKTTQELCAKLLASYHVNLASTWVSQKKMAEMLGCSVSTIERHLKFLRDQGFLATKKNGSHRHTNLYALNEQKLLSVLSPESGSHDLYKSQMPSIDNYRVRIQEDQQEAREEGKADGQDEGQYLDTLDTFIQPSFFQEPVLNPRARGPEEEKEGKKENKNNDCIEDKTIGKIDGENKVVDMSKEVTETKRRYRLLKESAGTSLDVESAMRDRVNSNIRMMETLNHTSPEEWNDYCQKISQRRGSKILSGEPKTLGWFTKKSTVLGFLEKNWGKWGYDAEKSAENEKCEFGVKLIDDQSISYNNTVYIEKASQFRSDDPRTEWADAWRNVLETLARHYGDMGFRSRFEDMDLKSVCKETACVHVRFVQTGAETRIPQGATSMMERAWQEKTGRMFAFRLSSPSREDKEKSIFEIRKIVSSYLNVA